MPTPNEYFKNGQVQGSALNVDDMSDSERAELIAHPATHQEVKRYAEIRQEAIKSRLAGDIVRAFKLESKADRIYNQDIPKHLRW